MGGGERDCVGRKAREKMGLECWIGVTDQAGNIAAIYTQVRSHGMKVHMSKSTYYKIRHMVLGKL